MKTAVAPLSRASKNGWFDRWPYAALHIPRDIHTLDGFRRWVLSDEFPEKVRVTFLRGEVYLDMGMEEIRTHAAVKVEVGGTIWNLNDEIDFGDIYINGVLVTNAGAQVSNNPDAVGISWASLESGNVRYVQSGDKETEIEGSPDWLLEIVSDSSVTKDRKQLRQAYHKAKVQEYWLIDARGKEIVFQILYWRKRGFLAAADKDGWQWSEVFRRHFHLSRTKDRRGAWKYRLQVRDEASE
ncbi:MAG: Uma2 family endonuclease [Gemmataceae bacterium]|nr:Uma2 family endonuclease [Gemmataceae bacterium]MCI0741280.1 Uma2 family endonuclease [Gemmataceae bacterium]